MGKFFSKIKSSGFNIFLISLLIFIGLSYRICGLSNNYSFWSDENHVAVFVRAILERGKPVLLNGYSTGIYQWLQYYLSAISSKIFGLNEFAIRFPSVIFGILTIWAVYLLGKELFNKNVGLLSAFLITFSKIEILWSRQARPYQALQFFFLLGAFFLYKLTKEKKFNYRYFLSFLICGILASLMHVLGLVLFFLGLIYLLITTNYLFKKRLIVLIEIFLFLLFVFIFKRQIFLAITDFGNINNFFYYRIFITHNYLPICLLAILSGFLLFRRKNYSKLILFIILLGIQLIINSFFLIQPFTRYFYPVFPFLILLSAFSLLEISQFISIIFCNSPISGLPVLSRIARYISQLFILIILVLFIINFGHKFSFLPQQVYSLNEDMQEIPEVDWKKIYDFVDEKLKENPSSILITNWNDLPIWYLGENKLDYLLRKDNLSNHDILSGAKLINNLDEMEKIINNTKNGLIVIDSWDDKIPDGLREYIRANLKKELEIDRLYSIQPRYWLVEVYSWDLE